MSSSDALAELRALAARFPVPDGRWHRFVPQLHEVVRDLRAALDAIEALPPAQAELLRRIEDEDDGVLACGPSLAAARARLRALPVPQGEHPFLDEIVVTLAAAETALAALASVDGDAVFASARQFGR